MTLAKSEAVFQILGTSYVVWIGYDAASSGQVRPATADFIVAAFLVIAGIICYRIVAKLEGRKEKAPPNLQEAEPDAMRVVKFPARPTLAGRIFTLCKEMRLYLKQVGPSPQYEGSTTAKGLEWITNVLVPWQDKLYAGYMLRFNQQVMQIRHELAEKGLRVRELDNFTANDAYHEDRLEKLTQALKVLAIEVDDSLYD